MENKKFSNIIKSHRMLTGYSQSEAARRLYITRSSYQQYESGKRNPPLETVLRMAALFKIHPIDMISLLIPKNVKDEIPNYINILYCGKYAFSSDAIHINDMYNSLDANEKAVVIDILTTLSKKEDRVKPKCRH